MLAYGRCQIDNSVLPYYVTWLMKINGGPDHFRNSQADNKFEKLDVCRQCTYWSISKRAKPASVWKPSLSSCQRVNAAPIFIPFRPLFLSLSLFLFRGSSDKTFAFFGFVAASAMTATVVRYTIRQTNASSWALRVLAHPHPKMMKWGFGGGRVRGCCKAVWL